jgi:hypothetical protein
MNLGAKAPMGPKGSHFRMHSNAWHSSTRRENKRNVTHSNRSVDPSPLEYHPKWRHSKGGGCVFLARSMGIPTISQKILGIKVISITKHTRLKWSTRSAFQRRSSSRVLFQVEVMLRFPFIFGCLGTHGTQRVPFFRGANAIIRVWNKCIHPEFIRPHDSETFR